MKLCCELCTTTEIPLQIICFSIQYDRLQYVIYELEDFCKRAKPEERNIFHRYINSCKSIYIGSICAFTVTGLLLIISPVVEPHPFPIDIEYPFSVDYQPLKIIIYLHHILLIYQSYAQRQPMSVKSTFLIFFISSLAKVYLCAWPADHLLNASTDIAHAVYESIWYEGKVDFQKNFLHALLRAQQPIAVNVPCMLPTVSLHYYASYVSTAFSYLATFRIILEESGED
ncbi:PREDICTED: uncharacterized protein LOC108769331 [Trachymyrmex cornetzi]|uniref:uncharacterized protein LOC108769331 n=1 Tax=Trachymyrmex cornetzi TaxID=471704 RepID=UPI00084EFDFB|nr:PREDICTED: uncharacterized protein LOC108769331 [Trachymyrmex cornetzi]